MESLHLDHLLDVLGLGGGHALHHHGAAPHRHAAHVRDRLEEGLERGAAEPPEGNVLPRLVCSLYLLTSWASGTPPLVARELSGARYVLLRSRSDVMVNLYETEFYDLGFVIMS